MREGLIVVGKTWFITGAGRGFGKEFARAALGRGDRVAATARDIGALADLADEYGAGFLPLALDVTEREAVFAAVADAYGAFGGLDVVVNNAGYGLFGAVEEVGAEELRQQLEVNVLGPFHVTQAVLPILREQGRGHIIQISSSGGVVAFPLLGAYHASKWALEGLSESLAQETAHLGIKVSLVEPGGYRTDWGGASAVRAAGQPPYQPVREALAVAAARNPSYDPADAGAAILALADAEQPPLRVFFGTSPYAQVEKTYQARLETWQQGRDIAELAAGNR
ncbi:SDR family NAD(P)-dependent oxidoreductase [Streptomyces sp. NPDC093252]|uniref:SDR family NAD(P)-dependent oxidoreductase n=1 Tax=Streptomyces sp. NPDC093252 TaxID=3154980 RepID=UPI003445079F